MKKSFKLLLIFLAIFFLSCNKQTNHKIQENKISSDILVTAKKTNNDESLISITLKNNTKKNIYIWTMSCSFDERFLTDNKNIKIKGKECDKNIQTYFQLKPEESKEYFLRIERENKIQKENFKIGFKPINNIFQFDREFDYFKERAKINNNKIFWSNIINI